MRLEKRQLILNLSQILPHNIYCKDGFLKKAEMIAGLCINEYNTVFTAERQDEDHELQNGPF
jgi:hypothetical protein